MRFSARSLRGHRGPPTLPPRLVHSPHRSPHLSMSSTYIFSSESVGEGHPDKVADTISDAVLDACLTQDPSSRVACETYVKSNIAIVGGEITTKAKLDYVQIVRDAVREIGYVHDDDVFHADKIFVQNIITAQSPDIAQGVDAKKAKGKKTAEQGAGDQGLMFGYACNETPELMPAPIMFAHRLGRELTAIRKSGKAPWLRPDAKSQVSVDYVDGKPTRIINVVISTQHAAGKAHAEIEKFCIEKIIKKVLPKGMLTKTTEFLINPTGNFVVGGPQGDTWNLTAFTLSNLDANGEIIQSSSKWYLGALAAFAGLLAMISIFQYRTRSRQMLLNMINSLVMVSLVAATFLTTNGINSAIQAKEGGSYEIGFWSILVAMVMNMLANRFIKKDEALVRSVDRIR